MVKEISFSYQLKLVYVVIKISFFREVKLFCFFEKLILTYELLLVYRTNLFHFLFYFLLLQMLMEKLILT